MADAEPLRLNEQLEEPSDGRFSRFELISWWDQERLANAKVVVIGAGALGNEIVKNLALLGVGRVFLADLDTVENSNLSRSVLFRESDCGRAKVDVASERGKEIYPEMRVRPFRGNVVYELGLGIFRWADVIIGGLDNREARVAINSAAARTEKVWIDGAIERLDGVARVFDPACGPCYECTMSETDWKMLEARRSCALLTREQMAAGKVPTTPTTASIIAGMQVQEAVKFLHGMETISGQGFVFDGTYHQSYLVTYTQKDDCPAHDPFDPIALWDRKVDELTVGELLDRVRHDFDDSDAVIELNHDLLSGLHCPRCNAVEPRFTSLARVTESDGVCPACGEHRVPQTYHSIGKQLGNDELLGEKTLTEIGVPPWDIVGGRVGLQQRYYELIGDRTAVLGELHD
ncbi:HesA/MoeB/ThiF family protein [Thalassoroseus pseudoceratinae]|uniref:HesA/MoeB/ThiF family protein n=1 Tax=Thalassoroseus pseudoceratinae TaxID=2713176 RepID=UPI00141F5072|nr:ThiF family adenylyltransferase [Thalassoroseus pseudoceratinae]